MKKPKKTLLEKFNYKLPPELISQNPIKPRDSARLLILDKKNGQVDHKIFCDIIKYLNSGDVLVLNNSKVIPARLIGKKINPNSSTKNKSFEIFLLSKYNPKTWLVLTKGKTKINEEILLKNNIIAKIIKQHDYKTWLVKFNCSDQKLLTIGQIPLPPYITKSAKMPDYQTVYAKSAGSVASPTAGLHFSKKLISQIKKKGVKIVYITLHIGLGTFLPVEAKYIEDHKIHSEFAILDKKTSNIINNAKKNNHKIIAVGTTSTRTLEAFAKNGRVTPQSRWVQIFIQPGYKFQIIDSLITNFHLPKSTLLILISALASHKFIIQAYQEAIKEKYKFFSFGDAMFIK